MLITAILTGGGVYYWKSIETTNIVREHNQIIQAIQQELTNANNQITLLDSEKMELEQENKQIDTLIEANVRFAMSKEWDVENIIQNPFEKNKFYYANNFNDASNIGMYNLDNDIEYAENNVISIYDGNSVIYSETIGTEKEFVILDVIDNNLVFVENYVDSSPGPCISFWFSDIYSIDLTAEQAVKQSYTVPKERLQMEQSIVDTCQASL